MTEIKEAKVVGQGLVEKGFKPKVVRFGKRVPFLRESIALFELLNDPAVGKIKKAVAVGALLYFIDPFDALPDFVPLGGFLDDAAIIAAAVTYVAAGFSLRKWRNLKVAATHLVDMLIGNRPTRMRETY
ncbi:MAG: DUF1232 domain-containing protein [Proteobacteria bacterium]|nr:DUF1232 domain-containing protein [Pseudomonadota bacterium]